MLRVSLKVLAAAAAAAVILAPAAGARDAPPASHGGVAIATSKHPSELRGTVPIARRGPGRARVVMSMGPGRLPDLRNGDKLQLYADVQVTMDCYRPLPRCAGRPYHFNPVVEGRLQISASGAPGGRSVTVATRKLQCLQHQPARQHHCPLVFDARDVGVDRRLPCPPSHCFVNVVVSAHSRAADGGEVVVIGANKPSGRIVRGKGEISALRIRPPTPAPDALTSREPRRRTLPLDARRRVVLSRRISGLGRGDALAVTASMRSDVRQLGYNALVGAQLILARVPRGDASKRRCEALGVAQGSDQPGQRHQLHGGPVALRDEEGRGPGQCVADRPATPDTASRCSSTWSSARSRSRSRATTATAFTSPAASSRCASTAIGDAR